MSAMKELAIRAVMSLDNARSAVLTVSDDACQYLYDIGRTSQADLINAKVRELEALLAAEADLLS